MRLRYSRFVHTLWLLWRKDVRDHIKSKQKFYTKVVGKKANLIFDVGANEGMLTNIFSQLSNHVLVIEPSERNIKILRAKFHNNQSVLLLRAAVSHYNGEQLFYEDKNDYATGTLSYKWNEIKKQETQNHASLIKAITLDNLIQQYGKPSYIKVDVEGYEWQVIQGLSQQIALLSFEAMLPAFMDETIQCIERLQMISQTAKFNFSLSDALVYNDYMDKEILLDNLKNINQTIDIFCKM